MLGLYKLVKIEKDEMWIEQEEKKQHQLCEYLMR
jgi:hypothetical protein